MSVPPRPGPRGIPRPLAGLYAATSAEVLLPVIAVTHLEMREELLPFVRFDGWPW